MSPARRPLPELARKQRPLTQVIAYNCSDANVRTTGNGVEAELEVSLLPAPDVGVVPNATLFKVVFDGSVTRDGLHLDAEPEACVRRLSESLFAPPGRQQGASSAGTVKEKG